MFGYSETSKINVHVFFFSRVQKSHPQWPISNLWSILNDCNFICSKYVLKVVIRTFETFSHTFNSLENDIELKKKRNGRTNLKKKVKFYLIKNFKTRFPKKKWFWSNVQSSKNFIPQHIFLFTSRHAPQIIDTRCTKHKRSNFCKEKKLNIRAQNS